MERVVVCSSPEEARDFQWYAIDKKRPHLNKYMQFWDESKEELYNNLLENLLKSAQIEFESTLEVSTEPGVYSLWHKQNPEEFAKIFLKKLKKFLQ